MRRAARLTIAASAVALALTGCDDDPAEDTDTDDGRTSVSWIDTDVCSLVPDDRVAALVGEGAAAAAGGSEPRRPECEWAVPGTTQRLVLRLWQPPVPDALTDNARRTTDVGDHTGYVESEGKGFCSMHVEAEPAWLTVDLHVPKENFTPQLCDEVATTADEVLAEVR